MRVRKNAPRANICTYIRANIAYMRIGKKGAWPFLLSSIFSPFLCHLASQLVQSKFSHALSTHTCCFHLEEETMVFINGIVLFVLNDQRTTTISLGFEKKRQQPKGNKLNSAGSLLTIPSITDSIGPSILPKDDPRDLKVMLVCCNNVKHLVFVSRFVFTSHLCSA